MRIDTLSPELQELCHKRQKEQGNDGNHKGSLGDGSNNNNFTWEKTPEGYEFWNSLYNGRDVTKSPFYPNPDKTINDYSIF